MSEEIDPNEHWINNPLISASSKMNYFNFALADMWDEAYQQGYLDGSCDCERRDNPYREEEDE